MGRLFLSVPGSIVRLRIDHMFGFGLAIEHMSDYVSNMRANVMRDRTPEGTDMSDKNAVLNAWDLEDLVLWEQLMTSPAVPQRRSRPAHERSRRRPAGSARPGGAPLRHTGTGVAMSRVRGPHRRRPITPATTVGLALLAAMITVWLGLIAQFGDSVRGASASLPDRLAVVQVRSGEIAAARRRAGGARRTRGPGGRADPRTQQARLGLARRRTDADRSGGLTNAPVRESGCGTSTVSASARPAQRTGDGAGPVTGGAGSLCVVRDNPRLARRRGHALSFLPESRFPRG